MKHCPWRFSFLWLALLAVSASPLWARDPIVVTESNGTQTAYTKDGIIDFANDYESNPRNVTLDVLGHVFTFEATASGSDTTSVRLISSEMGIDRTFTGANTGATLDALQAFLESDEFVGQFITLINTGAGGQVSGNPTAAIDQTVVIAQDQVQMSTIQTADEIEASRQLGGVMLAAGFTQFDSNGFKGEQMGGSPGYSWKLGPHKDRRFNFTLPVAVITLEGLRTYRVGTILQYVRPFYLTPRLTLRLGPDVSYTVIGSLDLPNLSGTIGGALTSTLTQNWEKYMVTFGGYYGRFQDLGGIKTNIQVNIGAYGLQLGRRLGRRSILTVYGEDTVNNVIGKPTRVYHTVGSAFTHRLLGRWNVTFGVARVLGIPGFESTEFSASSQWKF